MFFSRSMFWLRAIRPPFYIYAALQQNAASQKFNIYVFVILAKHGGRAPSLPLKFLQRCKAVRASKSFGSNNRSENAHIATCSQLRGSILCSHSRPLRKK
jgi:hypothetical protein